MHNMHGGCTPPVSDLLLQAKITCAAGCGAHRGEVYSPEPRRLLVVRRTMSVRPLYPAVLVATACCKSSSCSTDNHGNSGTTQTGASASLHGI